MSYLNETRLLKKSLSEKKEKTVQFNPETFSQDAITIKEFETLLKDEDIERVEKRINDFLSIVVSVEKAFVLFTTDKRSSMSFHVCGDKVFISPINHTLDIEPLNQAIYNFVPFDNINLEHPFVTKLSDQLNINITSFLCVPLRLNIAHERSEALICLVNRKAFIRINEPSIGNRYETYRGDYFSQRDVNFIKDLFESDVFKVASDVDWSPTRKDIVLYLGKVLLSKMQRPNYMISFSAVQLKNILNAELCSVYAVNVKKKCLVPIYFDRCHDPNIEQKCSSLLRLNSKATVCRSYYLKRVLTHTRPFTLAEEDVALDQLCRTNTHTLLCAPIFHRRVVCGVLELVNKGTMTGFNFLDEKYVSNFISEMEIFFSKYH